MTKLQTPFLCHIRDSIEQIEADTSDGKLALAEDRRRRNSVVRELEIIGEAIKHLSANLLERHPEMDWKRFIGTRDKLAHYYWGVDYDLIWDLVTQELPGLKLAVADLLHSVQAQESHPE